MADVTGETLSRCDDLGAPEGDLGVRPQLFLLLECARPAASSVRISLFGADSVAIGRGNDRSLLAEDTPRGRRVEVKVPDRWMSSSHARLWRLHGRWVLEDDRSKNGTRINGAPVTRAVLADRDLIELGQTFFLYRDAVPTLASAPAIEAASELRPPLPGLATFAAPLARDLADLARTAASNVSVVILGESGTGKEVVARAVHALSGRPGAFVAVNCSALPEALVEGELFGAKRGAYTGAEERTGLVRAADRGTLFLDELGDLPESAQGALLRVLQEREVVAIGDTRPVKVDFRLVAATHRDLDRLAATDHFRRDLLARFSGFTLRLPALRDRSEDLGMLIQTLLARAAPPLPAQGRQAPARSEPKASGGAAGGLAPPLPAPAGISPRAARALFGHGWPLNIRELEKCLEAAVVLAGDQAIELEHLPAALRLAEGPRGVAPLTPAPGPSAAPRETTRPPVALSAEDEEVKRALVASLERHGGNLSAVSRDLGKARMQLHRWIRRFGLDLDGYRR